jgi:protein-S-isoprenylcysteine O-methyltransferase Ste14
MATLILVLRTFALLCFAAPILLGDSRRRAHPRTPARQRGADRAPVVANFLAFAAFFLTLLVFSGSPEGPTALLLASSGSLLAVAGAGLVLRSRVALGPAWSFEPVADEATGLITAGPYRRVRHPIYLGLALLAVGDALAFSNWPAALIVLAGIVPTFAWRAHAEETVLSRTFGEHYERYRSHTKMIIPRVL